MSDKIMSVYYLPFCCSSSPIGKVNVIADTEPTVEQDEDDTFIVMESQVPVVTQDQVRIANCLMCLASCFEFRKYVVD